MKASSSPAHNNKFQCMAFSTNPNSNSSVLDDAAAPATYVHGVTKADLEEDANLQDFFAKNFPEKFGSDDDDDDIYIGVSSNPDVPNEEEIKISFAPPVAAAGEEEEAPEEEKCKGPSEDLFLSQQKCDLSLNIRPLIAYKRSEEGTRECYHLRETTNNMPGILYGSDPSRNIQSLDTSSKTLIKTPWKYIQRELDRFTYHKFSSRVYDLTLFEDENDTEGTVHRVMPRDVQFHPWQNKIYCCNYLRYFPGKPIDIPIIYINEEESPDIKRGGFIAPFNRHVTCIIEDGVKIPEGIELDCTGARLKDTMRKDRLIFPDGVTPGRKVKETFLIGTVFGRRADVEDETDDSEEES
jgi:large subunit ribosomal protein L25